MNYHFENVAHSYDKVHFVDHDKTVKDKDGTIEKYRLLEGE